MDKDLFKELFINYKSGTLSHAILIETNDVDRCYDDLLNFVKKTINYDNEDKSSENLDLENFSELIIINKEGLDIKKEQILEMQSKFSLIPSISKNNIYIVLKPEKMNISAGNTILKFLEEPENNIIGFFITENYASVLPTIVSRCSLYKKNYKNTGIKEIINVTDEEYNKYLNELKNIINHIESKDIPNLFFIKSDLKTFLTTDFESDDDQVETKKKVLDRNKFVNLLRILSNLYYLSLSNRTRKNDNEKELISLIKSNNTMLSITNKIKIIEEIIQNNSYNVNIDLSIDKLFIEMGKINA